MTDSIVAAGARFIMLVPNGGAVTGRDHVAFHNAGMDEALYARAYPGPIPWDPLHRYGLEPYYHTPLDTMEFMSRERLEEAAKIVAAGAYDILRPDTPNLSRSAVRRKVPVLTAEPVSYPPAYSD